MTKAAADIRSLARAQTALAIRTLTGICGSKAAPAAARVSAASALLDRGWGRPAQPHTGEDGDIIRVVLRTITEGRPRSSQEVDDPPAGLIKRPNHALRPGARTTTIAPGFTRLTRSMTSSLVMRMQPDEIA